MAIQALTPFLCYNYLDLGEPTMLVLGSQRPRGRPRSQEPLRSVPVTTHLTDSQADNLIRQAKSERMRVSEYVRTILTERVGK